MKDNNIKLYDFCNTRECDAADQDNDKVKEEELPPFAVVSSNTFTKLSDGRMVRGRDYPWGTVNIENKVKTDLWSQIYQSLDPFRIIVISPVSKVYCGPTTPRI